MREHESEPVYFVGGAEAPEQHGKGHTDEGSEEEPEDVFGFCDASVAAGEAHDELRACESNPERSGMFC